MGPLDYGWRWRRVRIQLWAPKASRVDLRLGGDLLRMTAASGGHWLADVNAAAALDYGFQLDGGDVLPDPRSCWQPYGVHGLSRLVDHSDFRWTDTDWRPPRMADLLLYELHIGTFTPEGTFTSAVDRLE